MRARVKEGGAAPDEMPARALRKCARFCVHVLVLRPIHMWVDGYVSYIFTHTACARGRLIMYVYDLCSCLLLRSLPTGDAGLM